MSADTWTAREIEQFIYDMRSDCEGCRYHDRMLGFEHQTVNQVARKASRSARPDQWRSKVAEAKSRLSETRQEALRHIEADHGGAS